MQANQLRLWFASMAFRPRRLKLLKIGAREISGAASVD